MNNKEEVPMASKAKFYCSGCELDFFVYKKDIDYKEGQGLKFKDGYNLWVFCPCCQMKKNISLVY